MTLTKSQFNKIITHSKRNGKKVSLKTKWEAEKFLANCDKPVVNRKDIKVYIDDLGFEMIYLASTSNYYFVTNI